MASAVVAGARQAIPGRRSRRALPNLFDLHPGARTAPRRELGLFPIRVEDVVGTAVEGAAQRGLDFRPLPPYRGANWKARWQRITTALDRLEVLPPIDVLKTAEGYWVTDGHNRVGAALALGQLEIDADVRVVLLPGQPVPVPGSSLAPVLEGSDQIRAAGRGRLSRGATVDQGRRGDALPPSARVPRDKTDPEG